MTEGMRWRDRLGSRLAVAFVGTALGAAAVAMGLALTTTGTSIDRLVDEQRSRTVEDVRITLTTAYEEADGWDDADLLPAHALAAAAGAVLTITTDTGEEVAPPPDVDTLGPRLHRRDGVPTTPRHDGGTRHPEQEGGDRQHRSGRAAEVLLSARTSVGSEEPATGTASFDEERSTEIRVDGDPVGTATLHFTAQERVDPVTALREAVRRNLLVAGAIAALLGLGVGAWVSPRLTRPLRRLTVAVRRIADGDAGARTQLPGAVGELGVLARSVDRMAEDLEREDRLRRALVADVAHEVRTPITVLLGEVEALQDGLVDMDAAHLASLHEEILRLARLVEDLDAVAAAEAAGRTLRRDRVDLAEVTSTAVAGLATHLDAVGVRLDLRVSPVTVLGDRGRLEQVVRNLLSNAAKFSPPGGRIVVEVTGTPDEAVLEVSDDGPGIPEAELPHVFERFWRGRYAEGTTGSGVGLAVVAELAVAHGGRACADNVPGRGARLTVRLPRSPAPVPARS
jgi:two-component system, OmpR family, sensor histidine kinase BaeS